MNKAAIVSIPGFGDATANKLLAWRAELIRRFVYNPAPIPEDVQAQAKVESEFNKMIDSVAAGPTT